jgi:hypothetical protein
VDEEQVGGSALACALARADALWTMGAAAIDSCVRLGRLGLPGDSYLRECAEAQSRLLTSPEFAQRVAAMQRPGR